MLPIQINPVALAQVFGSILAGGSGDKTPPASARELAAAGINPAVLAAVLAAAAQRPAGPAPDVQPARLAPQAPPFALNLLACVLPLGTFAAAGGLVYALIAGAAIGEQQAALVVALALILGVLLALTCAVVNWFSGSSLGSWTKNFVPAGGGQGAAEPPVVIPPPDDQSLPAPAPSEPGTGGTEPPEPPVSEADNFPRVHRVIAGWEGGYSDHPSDPGGATNFGITLETLSDWRGKAQTKADVKALSYDEALKIFRAKYWTPLRCDRMPVAIALMTYNAGVNSGISRGARFLQECLNKQGAGLEVDGSVGPLTLAAAAKADVRRVVDDYAAAYEAFYRSLKTFPTFGKGWLNRLSDVTARAREWAVARPPSPAEPRATGADLLQIASAHIGEKYVLGSRAPKDDVGYKGPWDCAELVSWTIYQASGIPYGWTDNSASPAQGDAYTGAFQRDAQTIGKMISVSQAAATPGAILLRYPTGGMGHIVFSDGKGGTVEAMSANAGVTTGKVAGRRWDTGILIPGIAYDGQSAVAVSPPAKLYAIGQPNMRADVVTSIQSALADKGFAVSVDGEYGPETAQAVAAFQRQEGVIDDGEVGEVTAPLLGVTL